MQKKYFLEKNDESSESTDLFFQKTEIKST